MKDEEAIRNAVRAAYARAVTSGGGCCGGGTVPQGELAKLAHYSPAELGPLPAGTAVRSFGCGNPLAFAEVRAGDVVLDLGSGAGIDIMLAARRVGPTGKVIGVDMTEEMILQARKNVAAAGLENVEVRRGLIEKLPVETSSVDWVISNCVINLSPEKDRVFAEIARVLRPGGRLRVWDIVARDLPSWILENQDLYSSCVAGAIDEPDYLAGLRRAGLRDVAVVERIVYDAGQLVGLVASELAHSPEGSGCCGPGAGDVPAEAGDAGRNLAQRIAAALAGKIWSANFTGRK